MKYRVIFSDFILLYSAMALDNSEHLHCRHTDYYALACSYLSMAILNQVETVFHPFLRSINH